METEIVKTLEGYMAPRHVILTTRKFRRNASHGMKVWRSRTRNFDVGHEVEHIEVACPNYTLTERGPVIERKKDKEDA